MPLARCELAIDPQRVLIAREHRPAALVVTPRHDHPERGWRAWDKPSDRDMPVAYCRVALVTGSSPGLGAVITRRLADDGLAVAVNGRRGDGPARDVGRSIRDGGSVAEAFVADVTDEQQVVELVAAITGRFGPIDVLVLNATGPQPRAPVTDVAWADHLAQLNFFAKSPVLLGRPVLPGRQARRYGRIVHIDSEVAHRPPPAAPPMPPPRAHRSAWPAAGPANLPRPVSP